jgi:hypothetical protein
VRVAARHASGLFHTTKRTEVVWVDGDSELAVEALDISATRRSVLTSSTRER